MTSPTSFIVPFIKNPDRDASLSLGLFVALSILTITGFSNAVNLSDGLDGLAGGCMAIVSFVCSSYSALHRAAFRDWDISCFSPSSR